MDDIPLLVTYLIERYEGPEKIKKAQKETLELFQAYDWPGNISAAERHPASYRVRERNIFRRRDMVETGKAQLSGSVIP
jgi:transcriptional regulator with GAF, ATPase, and Fis domain